MVPKDFTGSVVLHNRVAADDSFFCGVFSHDGAAFVSVCQGLKSVYMAIT
jgi:hypothetical protein